MDPPKLTELKKRLEQAPEPLTDLSQTDARLEEAEKNRNRALQAKAESAAVQVKHAKSVAKSISVKNEIDRELLKEKIKRKELASQSRRNEQLSARKERAAASYDQTLKAMGSALRAFSGSASPPPQDNEENDRNLQGPTSPVYVEGDTAPSTASSAESTALHDEVSVSSLGATSPQRVEPSPQSSNIESPSRVSRSGLVLDFGNFSDNVTASVSTVTPGRHTSARVLARSAASPPSLITISNPPSQSGSPDRRVPSYQRNTTPIVVPPRSSTSRLLAFLSTAGETPGDPYVSSSLSPPTFDLSSTPQLAPFAYPVTPTRESIEAQLSAAASKRQQKLDAIAQQQHAKQAHVISTTTLVKAQERRLRISGRLDSVRKLDRAAAARTENYVERADNARKYTHAVAARAARARAARRIQRFMRLRRGFKPFVPEEPLPARSESGEENDEEDISRSNSSSKQRLTHPNLEEESSFLKNDGAISPLRSRQRDRSPGRQGILHTGAQSLDVLGWKQPSTVEPPSLSSQVRSIRSTLEALHDPKILRAFQHVRSVLIGTAMLDSGESVSSFLQREMNVQPRGVAQHQQLFQQQQQLEDRAEEEAEEGEGGEKQPKKGLRTENTPPFASFDACAVIIQQRSVLMAAQIVTNALISAASSLDVSGVLGLLEHQYRNESSSSSADVVSLLDGVGSLPPALKTLFKQLYSSSAGSTKQVDAHSMNTGATTLLSPSLRPPLVRSSRTLLASLPIALFPQELLTGSDDVVNAIRDDAKDAKIDIALRNSSNSPSFGSPASIGNGMNSNIAGYSALVSEAVAAPSSPFSGTSVNSGPAVNGLSQIQLELHQYSLGLLGALVSFIDVLVPPTDVHSTNYANSASPAFNSSVVTTSTSTSNNNNNISSAGRRGLSPGSKKSFTAPPIAADSVGSRSHLDGHLPSLDASTSPYLSPSLLGLLQPQEGTLAHALATVLRAWTRYMDAFARWKLGNGARAAAALASVHRQLLMKRLAAAADAHTNIGAGDAGLYQLRRAIDDQIAAVEQQAGTFLGSAAAKQRWLKENFDFVNSQRNHSFRADSAASSAAGAASSVTGSSAAGSASPTPAESKFASSIMSNINTQSTPRKSKQYGIGEGTTPISTLSSSSNATSAPALNTSTSTTINPTNSTISTAPLLPVESLVDTEPDATAPGSSGEAKSPQHRVETASRIALYRQMLSNEKLAHELMLNPEYSLPSLLPPEDLSFDVAEEFAEIEEYLGVHIPALPASPPLSALPSRSNSPAPSQTATSMSDHEPGSLLPGFIAYSEPQNEEVGHEESVSAPPTPPRPSSIVVSASRSQNRSRSPSPNARIPLGSPSNTEATTRQRAPHFIRRGGKTRVNPQDPAALKRSASLWLGLLLAAERDTLQLALLGNLPLYEMQRGMQQQEQQQQASINNSNGGGGFHTPLTDLLCSALASIQDELCQLVPRRPDHQERIRRTLDVEHTRSMLRANKFSEQDWLTLLGSIVSIIESFEAAARGSESRTWLQQAQRLVGRLLELDNVMKQEGYVVRPLTRTQWNQGHLGVTVPTSSNSSAGNAIAGAIAVGGFMGFHSNGNQSSPAGSANNTSNNNNNNNTSDIYLLNVLTKTLLPRAFAWAHFKTAQIRSDASNAHLRLLAPYLSAGNRGIEFERSKYFSGVAQGFVGVASAHMFVSAGLQAGLLAKHSNSRRILQDILSNFYSSSSNISNEEDGVFRVVDGRIVPTGAAQQALLASSASIVLAGRASPLLRLAAIRDGVLLLLCSPLPISALATFSQQLFERRAQQVGHSNLASASVGSGVTEVQEERERGAASVPNPTREDLVSPLQPESRDSVVFTPLVVRKRDSSSSLEAPEPPVFSFSPNQDEIQAVLSIIPPEIKARLLSGPAQTASASSHSGVGENTQSVPPEAVKIVGLVKMVPQTLQLDVERLTGYQNLLQTSALLLTLTALVNQFLHSVPALNASSEGNGSNESTVEPGSFPIDKFQVEVLELLRNEDVRLPDLLSSLLVLTDRVARSCGKVGFSVGNNGSPDSSLDSAKKHMEGLFLNAINSKHPLFSTFHARNIEFLRRSITISMHNALPHNSTSAVSTSGFESQPLWVHWLLSPSDISTAAINKSDFDPRTSFSLPPLVRNSVPKVLEAEFTQAADLIAKLVLHNHSVFDDLYRAAIDRVAKGFITSAASRVSIS